MGKKRSKASKTTSKKRIKKEPEELSLEQRMYLENFTKLCKNLERSGLARCPGKVWTPMNYQSTVPYSALITPKISQNTPLTVLRRPRQGEWAISMSGSPLLVSSVPHDNTVNVNIPMEDGSVVSILPQRGLKRKDIPGNMSDHALKQLEDIYHNLDVLLHTGD